MSARIVVAVAALLLWLAHGAEAARRPPAPRLVLEPREATEDEPVWVCAVGAPPPRIVNLDGLESVAPALFTSPLDTRAPRAVNLSLHWPEIGPLALYRAIDARPRADALPMWGQDGWLRPGRYVLHAPGFRPDTLTVRPASAAERRSRAIVARARRYAAAGDSAQAARMLEQLLEREPGGPFAQTVFLALGDLLPYTHWHTRPSDWIGEWIARHLMECALDEGMRVWLGRGDEEARDQLARIVARYPGTPAAEAAQARLVRRETAKP